MQNFLQELELGISQFRVDVAEMLMSKIFAVVRVKRDITNMMAKNNAKVMSFVFLSMCLFFSLSFGITFRCPGGTYWVTGVVPPSISCVTSNGHFTWTCPKKKHQLQLSKEEKRVVIGRSPWNQTVIWRYVFHDRVCLFNYPYSSTECSMLNASKKRFLVPKAYRKYTSKLEFVPEKLFLMSHVR